jgi:hypothetical protein
MPTGKQRRRPQKKKVATRAGFNLKQLRKKIDELKKKLERHALNADDPQAQSTPRHNAPELSSNLTKIRVQGVQVVSEPAAKPEGKRELARRMMLEKIAQARNQQRGRSAPTGQLAEHLKN